MADDRSAARLPGEGRRFGARLDVITCNGPGARGVTTAAAHRHPLATP
jgi:hypothetical protein